jgi:hypothetical protein
MEKEGEEGEGGEGGEGQPRDTDNFQGPRGPPPLAYVSYRSPPRRPPRKSGGGREGFCGPEEFLFFSRFFFPFPSFSFFFLPTNFPRAPRSSRDPGFILYLGKARHVTRRR